MMDGPLQWFYLFGILHNGTKPAVDLKFRPAVDQRLFYHITEVQTYFPDTGRILERREIESVEKVVSLNKPKIHVINLNTKLKPRNVTLWGRLMNRPYFDRLEQQDLPGDFRSRDLPFGYAWMLFPSPDSLMTPKLNFYEGQCWSVKMAGGNFEMHYNLTKIDHSKNEAYVDGRNGVCLNREAGDKRWNATWIVDTRSGIIKQMQLDLLHLFEPPAKSTRRKITKVLTKEADDSMIFDYEIDEDNKEEL